jgi:16S rRNA (adenine1518-N6/adenine1519-N6)-dimethyltransferase
MAVAGMRTAAEGGTMPREPRPQRDLGQNFLVDEACLDAEIGYADVRAEDTVLEIGAGPGNLTERLAARAARVVVIEYDRQFRPRLESVASANGNVTVVWGDALTVGLPPFTKVVANLPYRVALPVIMRLLDQLFHSAVLIVQKDMAQKICAMPGEAGYGRVSVTVQRLARAELLDIVPRSAFSPPPRVDSAMLRLTPVSDPFPVASAEAFRRLLDNVFLRRGEKLADALPGLADVAALLPARLRGRQVSALTPEEFGEVSRFLDSHKVRLPAVRNSVKRRAQTAQRRKPGHR